ncbi:AT-hook motif nuclear-localized protein 14-like [Nymphaea colorata]|nr:AT-hook motif nuclear-localized protein 14-like [Nymphaea colorata]
MEGGESGLNSYYQAGPSANNGMFGSPPHSNLNASSTSPYSEGTALVFPHSAGGRPAATVPEVVRRKRGRPRKYGPGADAPVRHSTAVGVPLSSVARKKEPASAKKAQMVALGNAGQGFTPHIVMVAAGEDVSKKIMSFMQQRKRAICILSANGSISNASLRQPAMSGGTVAYEGRFEILSLSGSFLHSEVSGASSRTGGLSICLSGADGRIVGGGVGGPLIAASPVQVIIGSFIMDLKKDLGHAGKSEAPASKLPSSMVTSSVTPVSFRSVPDSSKFSGKGGSSDHMPGGGFMLQSRTLHMVNPRATDWSHHMGSEGRGDHDQSPDDGDDHLRD